MNNLNADIGSHDRIMNRPRLYAIASGKGGVGKSVIAFNLAHYLSRSNRVLLIDGDFRMGNLHLLANVAPELGWQAVCAGQGNFAEVVKPIKENLDLLASFAGQSEELLPNIKNLAACLGNFRNLAGDYDFVIIDTASGILPHSVLILNTVDEIILVTTPELTALSDSYALYKILIADNKHLAASLLVNREDRRSEVDYIYQKFVAVSDQYLNHFPTFFGYLGEDSVLVESVARQRATAEFAPQSKAAHHFADLAERLSGSQKRAETNLKSINFIPAGADIKE